MRRLYLLARCSHPNKKALDFSRAFLPLLPPGWTHRTENKVTICREWSLVNDSPQETVGIQLKCRTWACEHCAPDRRKQLMGQAASGHPTRFITLTANPHEKENPEDRLKGLSHAWRLIILRLRRLHPGMSIQYLAIVEETKRGEPHLHILFRGPFIPQRLLSGWMDELEHAPIVDIRKIKNPREVISYVAKYVTKAPAQFGTSKRYWQSADYQETDPENPFVQPEVHGKWLPDWRSLDQIYGQFVLAGYSGITKSPERVSGIPPPFHLKWEYTTGVY